MAGTYWSCHSAVLAKSSFVTPQPKRLPRLNRNRVICIFFPCKSMILINTAWPRLRAKAMRVRVCPWYFSFVRPPTPWNIGFHSDRRCAGGLLISRGLVPNNEQSTVVRTILVVVVPRGTVCNGPVVICVICLDFLRMDFFVANFHVAVGMYCSRSNLWDPFAPIIIQHAPATNGDG